MAQSLNELQQPYPSMHEQLDHTLQNLYEFISQYIEGNGFAPSLREISAGCYLGRSTVLRYLTILEARGRILRQDGKARSIRIVAEKE